MEKGQRDGGGEAGAVGFDRRQFMLRAGVAGVAGAVAWTAPQILSASPASAAVGSAPPSPQPPPGPNTDVLAVVEHKTLPNTPATPTVLADRVTPPATPRAAAAPAGPAALAATGTNAKVMTEWAAALLAGGTALVLAGQERQQKPQPVQDAAEPFEAPPAD